MTATIDNVAVIGAGTMGAAIAAHCANAGLPVLLLDVVPGELTADEQRRGLTLDDPAVKNRVVRDGFERIGKIQPPSFMSARARELVRLGNLDDDLEAAGQAGWIVEAVVEKLEVKRRLMARLDAVRRPGAIVTTNTSGLPISRIAEGLSDGFRRHFFGTHFFNPPRYMKLLEIIRGAESDPAAVATIAELASRRLGKGVVYARDTPNFIGNRILSIHGSFVMDYALEHGYRFEEVDALTGPLIGRPKSATFRLQDLVGIDVAWFVAQNLHGLIPDDPHRDVLASPRLEKLIGGLIERGRLGNKSGHGFYRKTKGESGGTVFAVLDPETFDYEPQREPGFESLAAAGKVRDLGERIAALFDERFDEDRGARFARAVVSHFLGYAAAVAPEVAFDLPSVDRAIRWGFSYELGPFELWDRLGVAATAERMEAAGVAVAPWVRAMLEAGHASFYRREDGRTTGYWDWTAESYQDLHRDPRHIAVEDLRLDGKELRGNAGASLLDLGDGVLLLELHSKMNALDDRVAAMMNEARELLDDDAWRGLVIGNDGPDFSVGSNLVAVAEAARQGDFDGIRAASRALQEALQALRYAPKPVVSAVHGMALGGGCEVAIGTRRLLAAAESYLGLVEVGVGLLPAGGGLKELVRRVISPAMALADADPLPAARKALETAAMAVVSTSAAEAAELGFLGPEDRVVMNRDQLLWEARQEVLKMAEEGRTPAAEKLYAGGRDLYAALRIAVWQLEQAGYASAHDALIARRVAYVLAGGDASAPRWVDEDVFLRLEREAFAELVATEKTQERIAYMLKTGKPLRN